MKILRLSIENIASIENAVIDFETGVLAHEPVFLICGDTGAGKSTILNAICLALYDRVPCLESTGLSGTDTEGVKNDNTRQLLRRGKAIGRVELDFIGIDKKHYTAVWEVQRAHRKINGNLQKTNRKFICEDKVYTKLDEIKAVTERAVGLTFDQFMRTTMLAQGQFASFLRADDKKKSEILEKLTGTEIFAEIGRKVHQRLSESNKKRENLETEIKAAHLLDDETKKQLGEEITELEGSTKDKAGRISVLENLISWLKVSADLAADKNRLTGLYEKATLAVNSDDHRERVTVLKKWDDTTGIRETMKRHSLLEQKTAELTKQLGKQGVKYHETIAGGIEWLKKHLTEKLKLPYPADNTLADKSIAALIDKQTLEQKEYEEKEKQYTELDVESLQKQWKEAGTEIEKATRIQEKLKQIDKLVNEAASIKELKSKTEASIKELDVLKAVLLEKLPVLEKRHEYLKGVLDGQMSLKEHITELRRAFAESKECPLCGNPDAHIHTDEQLDLMLQEALNNERAAYRECEECRRTLNENAANRKVNTASLADIEKRLVRMAGEIASAEKELAALAPDFRQEDFNEILSERKSKAEKDRETVSRKLDRAASLRQETDRLRKQIKDLAENLAEIKELKRRIDACQEDSALLGERFGQPQHPQPVKIQDLEGDIRALNATVNAILGSIESYRHDTETEAGKINLYFKESDYGREEVESMAQINENTIRDYRRQNQSEEDALKEAAMALETVNAQIERHAGSRPQMPEGTVIESAEEERNRLTTEKDDELRRLGSARQRLEHDRQTAQRLADTKHRLELSKTENNILSQLNKLFGGENGVNFRNIAQSYVLRALLEKANHYMRRLMPRYTLNCLDGSLTINVFDSFQGGALRNIGLLSGGETFVVSLALALGLSSIGKENIGVDTLFIDEGFGTLDNELLETVMTTLYNLHTIGGRRVGIISHLPDLKERIPTQIRLRRLGSGASETEVCRL